jgi:hypothetical protein
MSFLEIMHTYFRGEKLEALWFILPVGILLLTFGAVTLKAERGGFAWGVAIPCILFGLVFMGTVIGVGIRTKGQVDELEQTFQKSPTVMVEKELPRMEKVNTNFKLTFMVFGVLAAVGLGVHYLGGPNWGRGLGAALILISAIGLLVDGFAERRAIPYTAALEEIAGKHANQTGGSD